MGCIIQVSKPVSLRYLSEFVLGIICGKLPMVKKQSLL